MSTKCSNEEINILIITCITRHYSTKESLDFLKNHKIDISERTFYNKKSELKQTLGKRTRYILESLLSEHLCRIDELNQVDKELWKMTDTVTDTNSKLKILNSIAHLQNQISEFVEKTLTVMENQQKWFCRLPIGDKVDVEKFLEKQKKQLSTPYKNNFSPFVETNLLTSEELNRNRENQLKSFIEDEKLDSL